MDLKQLQDMADEAAQEAEDLEEMGSYERLSHDAASLESLLEDIDTALRPFTELVEALYACRDAAISLKSRMAPKEPLLDAHPAWMVVTEERLDEAFELSKHLYQLIKPPCVEKLDKFLCALDDYRNSIETDLYDVEEELEEQPSDDTAETDEAVVVAGVLNDAYIEAERIIGGGAK